MKRRRVDHIQQCLIEIEGELRGGASDLINQAQDSSREEFKVLQQLSNDMDAVRQRVESIDEGPVPGLTPEQAAHLLGEPHG